MLSSSKVNALLLLIAFFASLISAPAYSKNVSLDQATDAVNLRPYLYYLIDNNYRLDDLRKPPASHYFAPLKNNSHHLKSTANDEPIWLRFTIENRDRPLNHILHFSGSPLNNINIIDAYSVNGDTKKPLQPEKQLRQLEPRFHLKHLESGQTTIYLQLKPYHIKYLQIYLRSIENNLKHEFFYNTLSIALLAISIVLAIFSIIFAFIYRASYFGLYGTCLLILAGIQIDNFYQTSLTLTFSLVFPCIFFAIASAVAYMQKQHLNIRHRKHLLGFPALVLICFLSTGFLFDMEYAGFWISILFCLVLPIYLMAINYHITRDKITAILIAAYVVTAICLFGSLAFFVNEYSSYNSAFYFAAISIIIETIVILSCFYSAGRRRLRAEATQEKLVAIRNAKSNLQNNILQDLSRELRMPINTLTAAADLLKGEALNTRQLELVSSIRSASRVLNNQVTEVMYRAQTFNEPKVHRAPFEIRVLIEECLANVYINLGDKNIELISDIDNDVSTFIEGNDFYLSQIINTLLKNSITYTQEGLISLQVSSLSNKPNALRFIIQDTGRGIDQKTLNSLKNKNDAPSEHSGIPLAKVLLEKLHSKLTINSKLGEGTRFSFNLDLPKSKLANKTNQTDYSILQDKQVLIVNDNHAYSQTLRHQLQDWGMHVALANDATEAMAIFRAKHNLKESIHLMLINSDLAHLSGTELAERISKESSQKPLMVLMTDQYEEPDKLLSQQAGIDSTVSKPISQRLLKASITELFLNPDKDRKKYTTRILVAEDNDVSRRVIRKMLDLLNADYKVVSNGGLALDAAQRQRFDLILMDCEMPIMDGFTATQEIHRYQKSKHQHPSAVIALTAHTNHEQKQQAKDAGMLDILEKPVQLNELSSLIAKYSPDH